MKIFRFQADLKQFVNALLAEHKTIGFVPTMGALHDGHMSLVQQAKKDNDAVIVSVFINPTQFNNAEDLAKYPRTEEADLEMLIRNDCDAVYIPAVADLYEADEQAKKYDFGGIEKVMEGKFRPGHFDGVATVVSKLLKITQPTRAYFGEKDFQQIRIIQEMVKQEKLAVQIVPMPIHRAETGLALSSRNARLTPEFLEAAPFIYNTLQQAKTLKNEGKSVEEVKNFVVESFASSSFDLEYFEITDEKKLLPLTQFDAMTPARGFVVAYAGDIRLIDNIAF
ncbi:pantoate--beta-alanine ligase [Vaginella massiliensis]|uniref:pantoate--beta-alanine ligase n=1 Tax=Vaginella massiliensis TaxID=1816680 RepID=UPI0008397259|nr:pantoate--beta-alanine ligase [Vaginella massiliensis]